MYRFFVSTGLISAEVLALSTYRCRCLSQSLAIYPCRRRITKTNESALARESRINSLPDPSSSVRPSCTQTRVAEGGQESAAIICGDFNSTPGSMLVTDFVMKGSISFIHVCGSAQ